MKIKTSELTGAALDWAVAKSLGCELVMSHDNFRRIAAGVWDKAKIDERLASMGNYGCYLDTVGNAQPIPTYHKDWAQGGPIIEREKIDLNYDLGDKMWNAHWYGDTEYALQWGDTPLIAAMRCYVASRLGDEVDVPEELL